MGEKKHTEMLAWKASCKYFLKDSERKRKMKRKKTKCMYRYIFLSFSIPLWTNIGCKRARERQTSLKLLSSVLVVSIPSRLVTRIEVLTRRSQELLTWCPSIVNRIQVPWAPAVFDHLRGFFIDKQFLLTFNSDSIDFSRSSFARCSRYQSLGKSVSIFIVLVTKYKKIRQNEDASDFRVRAICYGNCRHWSDTGEN